MKPPPYFEAIRSESERRWQQLEADPDLAGPWRMLFDQVKDPRHLLSELFQNADDAGATRIEVRLTHKELEVRHDGRDFSESDLRTLCRFASSNKRTLATIGFRGIGFKSVFAAGPTVRLTTPTLSLRFDETRFTQPIWEDGPGTDNEIVVRVTWRSDDARAAVAESLVRWKSSPAGLLFFRSVDELQFDGLCIRRTRIAEGPVPDSADFGLEREADGKRRQEQFVTIFRSREIGLPDDCRREIEEARRSEGGLGEAEVRIEIVLGLRDPQRLHSVLPTDATWAYPFSCNAPFMLTPDRSRLKDPSDSPTNRWLLDEAGKLAAQALAGWVGNRSRSLADRAGAYALLPVGNQKSHQLGEAAAIRVRTSFLGELITGRLHPLLRVDGSAGSGEDTVVLPSNLLLVWEMSVTMELLGTPRKIPLAGEVPLESSRALQDLGLLAETSDVTWLAALARHTTLPRPK